MTLKKQTTADMPFALVTGATGDIGEACVKDLVKEGFIVGIHFRTNRDRAERILSEIDRRGILLSADITDTHQVDTLISQIKKDIGRVDVLVNNAGFSINHLMVAMPLDAFDHQRSLTRGVWYLTKMVLRRFMVRQSMGRIINISSVTAHTGNAGQVPYTMEKAALDAMTRSLAKELSGRNILINSVAPGFIDTEMTRYLPEEVKERIHASIPLGRVGMPSEVSEVVRFLSVGGNYIQGSVIHVNGGLYAG